MWMRNCSSPTNAGSSFNPWDRMSGAIMQISPTTIPDVLILEPTVCTDERGYLMETFQERTFRQAGLPSSFVQENHSHSHRGVLRGLHYQIRHAQGKLVRVVQGEIFDVVVDLRRRSPRYGNWTAVRLSAENRQQLWVPPGCAHGYLVESESADVTYKVTDFYAPEWERTLSWNDPQLAIAWPLAEGVVPQLSAKDACGASFAEADKYP